MSSETSGTGKKQKDPTEGPDFSVPENGPNRPLDDDQNKQDTIKTPNEPEKGHTPLTKSIATSPKTPETPSKAINSAKNGSGPPPSSSGSNHQPTLDKPNYASDGSDGVISTPPSSPSLLADDESYRFLGKPPMDITPIDDDFVIYSDSDGASSGVEGSTIASTLGKSLNHDQTPVAGKSTPRRPRKASKTSIDDDTPSPKPKKRIRRKSNRSVDGSERSHRSSNHPIGTGYTSMPTPGKIFRNLLILEESLRQQVKQQRALRRKYLTFLAILCSLMASISHHLFFSQHTSTGTMRVILQFILLALLVTLMLYHLSGEYQNTIVLPRKFLSSTNKGLRQLNVRLVKIKTSWTDSIIDLIREFSLFFATMCLNCLHQVYPTTIKNKNSRLEVFLVSCQSQCQPRIGVTDVKLVLNARSFNTDVREGWELYRSEFWIHEGLRRRKNMMSFMQEEKVLDRGKLLKKDKKDRKDRRKSLPVEDVGSPKQYSEELTDQDDFPVVNTPPHRLSESNLKRLSQGFD